MGSFNKKLHDAVAKEASEGKFVLSLGGDHSMVITWFLLEKKFGLEKKKN